MRKECGDCTLCCLVLPTLEEVKSKPGELCEHCDLNKGCTIHEERPISCREFYCSWILDDNITDVELRPDRSQVIFEKVTEKIHIGTLNPYNIIGWNKKIVLDYIKGLNNSGISVILTSFTNNPKLFMLADGETEEGIMRDAMKELNERIKRSEKINNT